MVRRPDSIPEARRAMREALQVLASAKRGPTAPPCVNRPVPYTEVRQSPREAADLCGRGTDAPCPVLELCASLGFTESVYADDMVYGGYVWRRGLPLISEAAYQKQKKRVNKKA